MASKPSTDALLYGPGPLPPVPMTPWWKLLLAYVTGQ